MGLNFGGGVQNGSVDLCFQPAGGAITNFSGIFSVGSDFVGGDRRSYSATSSTIPGAGTWAVGLCVRNGGSVGISYNGAVSGWVMVT